MNLTTALSCILLAVLNMVSCEREEEEPERLIIDTKIAHHLYQNCDNKPYANLDLFFYSRVERAWNDPKIEYLGSTTTNENGYFSFETNTCATAMKIDAFDANGTEIFSVGCIDTGYPKRDLTSEGFTSHPVKIVTTNPLSLNDTLLLGMRGLGGRNVIATGPFYNNQIIKIDSVLITGIGFKSIGSTRKTDVWWGMGKAEFDQVSTNPSFQKPPNVLNDITQVVCSMGDTIVIDLRGY